VRDNLVLPVLRRLAGRTGLVPPARREAEAARWVEALRIKAPALNQPVQQLSGGNQQRVVLAKWLATEPKLLILDSPTVGVDIKNKQGIYEMVRRLAERGMGVLLITDEIAEAFGTCDRVLHMREGRIIETVTPGEIPEHAFEERVYA
jgi:simple sugar transport system ATP-binding protein